MSEKMSGQESNEAQLENSEGLSETEKQKQHWDAGFKRYKDSRERFQEDDYDKIEKNPYLSPPEGNQTKVRIPLQPINEFSKPEAINFQMEIATEKRAKVIEKTMEKLTAIEGEFANAINNYKSEARQLRDSIEQEESMDSEDSRVDEANFYEACVKELIDASRSIWDVKQRMIKEDWHAAWGYELPSGVKRV